VAKLTFPLGVVGRVDVSETVAWQRVSWLTKTDPGLQMRLVLDCEKLTSNVRFPKLRA
jgi:hypothetical protein